MSIVEDLLENLPLIKQILKIPPAGTGEANTASNVNAAGVGVFKQKTGINLEFRGINAGSSKLSVTLDAANNEIDLDVVESNLNLANIGGSLAGTQLAANAVGNGKLSTMATATVKGNSTGSTGNAQDMTLLGGLTVVSGTPGSLKSKGSFAFGYTWSTNTAETDPGTNGAKANNATMGSVTELYIDPVALGGRNIAKLIEASGQIGYIANNESSTSMGVFNISSIVNNADNFYSVAGTFVSGFGSLPANGDEILLVFQPAVSGGLVVQDLLDLNFLRIDANGFIIDGLGNILSGPPTVADYAALLALNAANYDGFAVNIQSGLNNAFFASNGTAFGPLNGQYVQERNGVPQNTYIFPDNVTWTASDNGSGKVRLTASAVHNMAEADAEGSYLYLISGGTGWTAGTSHRITPATGYISTTVVDLDTTYTGGMGVPVFAKAGTVEANSEIPLLNITLPALRANSEVIVEASIEYSDNASTGAKRAKFYLESTQLTNQNNTTANTVSAPYRFGFKNQNDASIQRGLSALGSSGYASGTGAVQTAASATGTAGKVISIRSMCNVPGLTAKVGGYTLIIRN